MTLEGLGLFFGWCALINTGILIIWWLMYIVAQDWIYNTHGKWFDMTKAEVDRIHYGGMLAFKLAIWLFNITPYLAIQLAGTGYGVQ